MFTGTSLSALRLLLYLGQAGPGASISPKRIAERLGESPTYLAKVASLLVKAGILHAEKGVKGGVQLGQAADKITLLGIVEACQGAVLGDYCRGPRDAGIVCSYHQASVELHDAIVGVLSRWNLARLLERPSSVTAERVFGLSCQMLGGSGAGRGLEG